MAKEYKTLTFKDDRAGRRKLAKAIDKYAKQGWEVQSKEVSAQGYKAGKTCLLGCLFLPLALLGKKNSIITLILEREVQPQQTSVQN